MNNKLHLFLGKTLLFVIPVLLLFEMMFRRGFSPIITNSTLFDIKMLKVQKQGIKNVRLLSIGSSIGLYELNSRVMVEHFNMPYYNFSSWGFTVADMKALLDKFVKEYQPKYVIMCSSLGDFMTAPNESYFNYLNSSRWIRDNLPEYFYFNDYHSIHQIVYRKYHAFHLDLDEWGGSSLTIQPEDINKEKWDEHFLFPTVYTGRQYAALDDLCVALGSQKVKFIFVQAPIKASYTNTPSSRQIVVSHFEKCRSIVESHGAVYLNYYDTATFADSLFFDQSHLQVSGALILTKKIAADCQAIIK
jgi:hypothetical protein